MSASCRFERITNCCPFHGLWKRWRLDKDDADGGEDNGQQAAATTGLRLMYTIILAVAIAAGFGGCGGSEEQAQQAAAKAEQADVKAAEAEAAANRAHAAARQAEIAAERAQKAVDAATREINRVADHLEQMNQAHE